MKWKLSSEITIWSGEAIINVTRSKNPKRFAPSHSHWIESINQWHGQGHSSRCSNHSRLHWTKINSMNWNWRGTRSFSSDSSLINNETLTVRANSVVLCKRKQMPCSKNRYSRKRGLGAVPRPQFAFKDSMIHWILQFAWHIAFRCVLHRCENQDIQGIELFLCFEWLNRSFDGSTGQLRLLRPAIYLFIECSTLVSVWVVLATLTHTSVKVVCGVSSMSDCWLSSEKQQSRSKDWWRILCEIKIEQVNVYIYHTHDSSHQTSSQIGWFKDSCEWSLRRFTYGDLVTTFTSSKWASLIQFSRTQWRTIVLSILEAH